MNMNSPLWFKRIPGVLWVQGLLALLLVLPHLHSGEWRCEDGRYCQSCNASSDANDKAGDCDCPVSGQFSSDCHSCCSYISFHAPLGDKSHKASAFHTTALADLVPARFVFVVASVGTPAIQHYSVSPPHNHALPAASPRAPPAFVTLPAGALTAGSVR